MVPCPACGELTAATQCPTCGVDLDPVHLCAALAEQALGAAEQALRKGRPRQALRHLDEAATLAPPGPRHCALRGLGLLAAGRVTAARADLAGTASGARLLAAPGTAALAAAEARYFAARALLRTGAALAALAALAAGPATGDGLVLYALAARSLHQPARAAAALRLALTLDPSNTHAAALLGL